ncbi:hypothetical protein T07_11588 [Trichinella nelsoni]|uniref:Uncharacterized protein n=1 Tax=Trichinella nelsoni TaxID=6336 RepID=A0A0V0S174_9BILA|nr:hypothetical protein T07_11588 [Trichinella nelsoni]
MTSILTDFVILAELFSCSFCSGHCRTSGSHQFVLNVASQTSLSIEFAPDCFLSTAALHYYHEAIEVRSNSFSDPMNPATMEAEVGISGLKMSLKKISNVPVAVDKISFECELQK